MQHSAVTSVVAMWRSGTPQFCVVVICDKSNAAPTLLYPRRDYDCGFRLRIVGHLLFLFWPQDLNEGGLPPFDSGAPVRPPL